MKTAEKPFVEIYTDGACSGNPGIGGFGVVMKSGGKVRELSGCDALTTNNRMEMLGVITALESLKMPCRVVVTTDSNYIVKGMNEWIHGWIRRNWINSERKEVLNRDLWERLLKTAKHHEIEWVWIRGHAGHAENERCDRIARDAVKHCRRSLAQGKL